MFFILVLLSVKHKRHFWDKIIFCSEIADEKSGWNTNKLLHIPWWLATPTFGNDYLSINYVSEDLMETCFFRFSQKLEQLRFIYPQFVFKKICLLLLNRILRFRANPLDFWSKVVFEPGNFIFLLDFRWVESVSIFLKLFW